jgi:hypothetical protein
MVLPDDAYVVALALADLGLYGWASYALLRPRYRGREGAKDISEAFAALGAALKEAIPDIPPGFTWNEAVLRSKALDLRVDWDRVGRAVRAYEARRYGGEETPGTDYSEVLVLARELRRRG